MKKIKAGWLSPARFSYTPESLLKKAIMGIGIGDWYFFFSNGKYILAVIHYVVFSLFDFGWYWLYGTGSAPCMSHKSVLFNIDEKQHQWLFSSLVVFRAQNYPISCWNGIAHKATYTGLMFQF